MHPLKLIEPDWPAPSWIKAFTTTRIGGMSEGCFTSLNLSLQVGDQTERVLHNHHLLKTQLNLPNEPVWLKQVHGNQTINLDQLPQNKSVSNPEEKAIFFPVADASYTTQPHQICTILTADCLPLFICSRTLPCIAAIHAGWKGLLAGVIENTIRALDCASSDLLVWLGPAIGPKAFVVGENVFHAFTKKDSAAKKAFQMLDNDRWLADIYQLAKHRLHQLGITAIYGGIYCTYQQADLFYSYRRDKVTGRMASLIWIE